MAHHASVVTTVEELNEIVDAIRESGVFAFDVETRGTIRNHPEVIQLVEDEWAAKKATLKVTNADVIARSRQAIEDRWTKNLALDPLRNEVSWISIAIAGGSWVIPISHPNGEIVVPGERGDGTTVPPPGYRAILASGKESKAKTKYYIPAIYSPPPYQLPASVVWETLAPVFLDPSIPKVNENVQFDCRSVAKYIGGMPQGDYIELMVLQHILNENLLKYSLEENIHRNFENFDPYHRHGKIGAVIDQSPFSVVAYYGHLDARWAWLTYRKLWRKIAAVPQLLACARLDCAAMTAMAQASQNGILVNKREMVKFGKELEIDLNKQLMEMSEFVPIGFNPNSDQHVRQLLFGLKRDGGLALKPKKKTDGGVPSVDAKVMGALKGEHPIIDMLLDYAELEKLKSTFVDGMLPMLHHGRAHPNFNFHKTVTSRLSCDKPNLQNQSRDDRIRDLFMAEPGNSLLVADYSAIELRILGALSGDPNWIYIFLNDIDPHLGTAAGILRVTLDEVTHEQRVTHGKNVNFLLGYGGGAKRLVETAKGAITLATAEGIVNGYDDAFPVAAEWKLMQLSKAKKLGYAETLGGRRRRLPDLQSSNKWERLRAERQVINHIIQGTAAEICKRAIISTHQMLDYPKARLLLQVHDELVLSVPTDECTFWQEKLVTAMGHGEMINGLIPLHVSSNFAGTWGQAK